MYTRAQTIDTSVTVIGVANASLNTSPSYIRGHCQHQKQEPKRVNVCGHSIDTYFDDVWKNDDHLQTDLPQKTNEQKAYDTRYSQAVTHPSTNRARRCLTSVIGRELVYSTWYGRKRRAFISLFGHSRHPIEMWKFSEVFYRHQELFSMHGTNGEKTLLAICDCNRRFQRSVHYERLVFSLVHIGIINWLLE